MKIILIFFAIVLLSTLISSNDSAITIVEVNIQCLREITAKIFCNFPKTLAKNDVIEITSATSLVSRTLSDVDLKDATEIDLKSVTIHLAFGLGKRFKQLEALWIVKSILENVERENFADMMQLRALNLYENKISFLPSSAFYDLPNLEFLDIDNNQLSELHEDLLIYQPELLVFRASYNRIEIINEQLFRANTKIQQIHLNNNQIKVVNVDFLQLDRLIVVDLEDNYGECSIKAGYYDDNDEDDEVDVGRYIQSNVDKFCKGLMDLNKDEN